MHIIFSFDWALLSSSYASSMPIKQTMKYVFFWYFVDLIVVVCQTQHEINEIYWWLANLLGSVKIYWFASQTSMDHSNLDCSSHNNCHCLCLCLCHNICQCMNVILTSESDGDSGLDHVWAHVSDSGVSSLLSRTNTIAFTRTTPPL